MEKRKEKTDRRQWTHQIEDIKSFQDNVRKRNEELDELELVLRWLQ